VYIGSIGKYHFEVCLGEVFSSHISSFLMNIFTSVTGRPVERVEQKVYLLKEGAKR